MVLLRDTDGGVSLGLEPNQHLPLGTENIARFAGEEEGQAAILGAAHLNLSSTIGLNAGQLLVDITAAKSFNVEAFSFFSRDVEYLEKKNWDIKTEIHSFF